MVTAECTQLIVGSEAHQRSALSETEKMKSMSDFLKEQKHKHLREVPRNSTNKNCLDTLTYSGITIRNLCVQLFIEVNFKKTIPLSKAVLNKQSLKKCCIS